MAEPLPLRPSYSLISPEFMHHAPLITIIIQRRKGLGKKKNKTKLEEVSLARGDLYYLLRKHPVNPAPYL
jgi:hypothetical protein